MQGSSSLSAWRDPWVLEKRVDMSFLTDCVQTVRRGQGWAICPPLSICSIEIDFIVYYYLLVGVGGESVGFTHAGQVLNG